MLMLKGGTELRYMKEARMSSFLIHICLFMLSGLDK
ncbi:MAG: hypothetical protein CSYNP_04244 [Syntrophus sp. SKADARSKE-3]|nr:hypothetical protein [Syntrophus sp. SKADARSKE-3]